MAAHDHYAMSTTIEPLAAGAPAWRWVGPEKKQALGLDEKGKPCFIESWRLIEGNACASVHESLGLAGWTLEVRRGVRGAQVNGLASKQAAQELAMQIIGAWCADDQHPADW